ncbi:MAG: CehA/McbA family metallohydrolase [Armatimonadetes bacterium]|nr:CehA/McbA family metallohydrolase [Armatimonadota bacterium]
MKAVVGMIAPFSLAGEWYKGNLHTHSTESDGQASPQQLVDIYAENAYDFLAITDHMRLTDTTGLEARGMVLIPGSELHGGQGELGQHYHVVALGVREPISFAADATAQQVMEAATARSELCFVAHPSWSSLTYRDLLSLPDHLGIEVYNTTCHHGIGRGESAVQWDDLLARGQRLLGLAVDDAHLHYPDAIGGWVMVKAPERSEAALLTALRQGHFYSSTGPTIEMLESEEDRLYVKCSPVQEIRVICPKPGHGSTSYRLGRPGPFTEAEFAVREAWEVVRVEVVDARGRVAWSNPIWFV